MRRSLTSALTAGFALALALACPAPAHAADEPVLESDGTRVSFEIPAPGGTAEWTMRVRSTGAHEAPLPLSLALVEATGSAVGGPHPLRLALADDDGGELAIGEATALVGRALQLEPLPAGRERTVAVRAELPAEAGDEYRGAQAELRFRFSAERPEEGGSGWPGDGCEGGDADGTGATDAEDAGGRRLGRDRGGPGGPADLAVSGADVLVPVLVAGALAATGLAIVVATARRRGRDHERAAEPAPGRPERSAQGADGPSDADEPRETGETGEERGE